MRILGYSENRLFGECLERGLCELKDVEWAKFVFNLPQAIDIALGCSELDILIDLRAGNSEMILKRLRDAAPAACIVSLAVDNHDTESIVSCARHGFDGFIPLDATLDTVTGIIRDARIGEVALCPRAAGGLMRALGNVSPNPAPEFPVNFTPRERQICRLVCDGLTNKEIAHEVNRSVGTVKNHVHSILSKLDLSRRAAIPARLMSVINSQ